MTKVSLTGLYCKEAGSYFSQDNFQILHFDRKPEVSGKPSDLLIVEPCCGLDTLPDGSQYKASSCIVWETATTGTVDFEGTRYKLLPHSNGCIQIVEAGVRGKGL